LPDACEAIFETNPNDPDSDDDLALDGVEVRFWLTNPLSNDSDSDGCQDKYEIGSVNADRRVNSGDLNQLASFFGVLPAGLKSFDMNGDGVMNSMDLSFAALSFGVCSG
jgi:hypothetical protein